MGWQRKLSPLKLFTTEMATLGPINPKLVTVTSFRKTKRGIISIAVFYPGMGQDARLQGFGLEKFRSNTTLLAFESREAFNLILFHIYILKLFPEDGARRSA